MFGSDFTQITGGVFSSTDVNMNNRGGSGGGGNSKKKRYKKRDPSF